MNFVLVLPDARGLGLARMLMKTALTEARNIGFETLRLETYSCLIAARNLYAKYGFEIIEIEPDLSLFSQVFVREFLRLRLS